MDYSQNYGPLWVIGYFGTEDHCCLTCPYPASSQFVALFRQSPPRVCKKKEAADVQAGNSGSSGFWMPATVDKGLSMTCTGSKG